MSDKVKSRLIIAGAAFCAALFLFSGAMLAREYLDHADLILYTMKSDAPGRASDLTEIRDLIHNDK